MLTLDRAMQYLDGAFQVREKRPGVFKVLVPFQFGDGDMYELFIEESLVKQGLLRISDYALTLMRLSYSFDIDTEKKLSVLLSLIKQNYAFFDDGNIYMDVTPSQVVGAIHQFIQLITKVMGLKILTHDTVISFFYSELENILRSLIKEFANAKIVENAVVTQDDSLIVDYKIFTPDTKPIFLYGIKDDDKASKVIISCLNFMRINIPFRSFIINDESSTISRFHQAQLTNSVDKQFTSLGAFQKEGATFLRRELLAS